ncbi:hypothetical protein GYH30_052855 [Glycine max]|nr:hypothetical protein GYH30_052855 [Glycine max]
MEQGWFLDSQRRNCGRLIGWYRTSETEREREGAAVSIFQGFGSFSAY